MINKCFCVVSCIALSTHKKTSIKQRTPLFELPSTRVFFTTPQRVTRHAAGLAR